MNPSLPVSPPVDILVLAAGQGTRMPSPRPKVLQTLLGESMLSLVYGSLSPLPEVARMLVVVGHEADLVKAELATLPKRHNRPHGPVPHWVEQTERLGTGHALMTALPLLENASSHVLVVNGDIPLLDGELVRAFIHHAHGADIALLSLGLEEAGAYGRVVRHNGNVVAVVEAKDYDPALHGPDPKEINTGIYLIRHETARLLAPRLTTANRSKEYYITDLVHLAAQAGMKVLALDAAAMGFAPQSALSLLGVNNPVELAQAENRLQQHICQTLLNQGVILHGVSQIRISPLARIAPGAEIFGPCEIYGNSRVEAGAVIESHCVLNESVVEPLARIRSFSHLDQAMVGKNCVVGPYGRLRPGAVMENNSHVGNFVEMKNSRLGEGAKANHLTYLGDADIGPGVNIGAGTITCNYDGARKHRTHIGAGSFIGSNTALVAPISVGENSLIGAGSVITKDVPDQTLAVARGKQRHIKRS